MKTAADHRAGGADRLSSQTDVSTSRPSASLTASKAAEPIEMPALSKAPAGGHYVTRRIVMNVMVGGATALAGKAVAAPRLASSGELSGLIEEFYAAHDVWLAAVDVAEEVDRPNMSIKVLGGKAPATTVTNDGMTITIPEREWYFTSLESIQKEYRRDLADARKTDSAAVEAIEARYDAFQREATEQARVIKAASAEYRRAEAKVKRASRAEQRALQAIINFEPKSRADALKLLEFVATERANRYAFDQVDDVCFFIQKAHRVLSMVA